MSPTFRALHNRNYRLYAAGGVVSNTGTWMQRVAQDWLVVLLATNAGTALGITTGLQFLPALLLSPYAGLVADRMPKLRLLKITQTVMALTALVLGALAVTGTVQVWHVYVLAFTFGIGSAFDAPARQSFVSEMVGPDEVTNAVGLNSASFNAARMLGPAVAGLLIAAFGGGVEATGWVIVINGLSYSAVLLALARMNPALLHLTPAEKRHKGMIRDAVRYLRGRPDLLMVLSVVGFAGTFGLNFQMTSALMATQVFDKGATEYGLLGSIMAIGSLSGALLAARRTRVRLRLVVGSALLFGVVEIAAGLMPTYTAYAVIVPLLGLSALTMITAANTTMQLATAPHLRGRVMALYLMVFMGGTPIGSPFIGWIGETFGARWTLIGGGALVLVGVLGSVALFARSRHRLGEAVVVPERVAVAASA
ncbi:Predicted arabinose efflux permease, MFS family [Nocardioides scoriae]|uniref:Predicted arabinose efflux permease, MFS family n=1 Tax=Nocardioides scoriae TaxID=642780 RepID=A0A1H1SB95_9ACTN|nr:MFS transporter [Nocardioides scoriae]SDS45234.1 Predicted arabinose efflux permease, MFS family [Nocardioides scoriae]